MTNVAKYRKCPMCDKGLEPFESSMVCPDLHVDFRHFWSKDPKLCFYFDHVQIIISEITGINITIYNKTIKGLRPTYKHIKMECCFDDFMFDKKAIQTKIEKIVLLS